MIIVMHYRNYGILQRGKGPGIVLINYRTKLIHSIKYLMVQQNQNFNKGSYNCKINNITKLP